MPKDKKSDVVESKEMAKIDAMRLKALLEKPLPKMSIGGAVIRHHNPADVQGMLGKR